MPGCPPPPGCVACAHITMSSTETGAKSAPMQHEGTADMAVDVIRSLEQEQQKEVPNFGPGDTVRVHAKVVEGTRERVQVFEGIVIRRRGGGINENFTVRRMAAH